MEGKKGRYFVVHKALRQGDHISFILFVLCKEKLTHMIQDEVDLGNWDCIKIRRNYPKISHILFVDDLLIFGKAIIRLM